MDVLEFQPLANGDVGMAGRRKVEASIKPGPEGYVAVVLRKATTPRSLSAEDIAARMERGDPVIWARAGKVPGLRDRIIALLMMPPSAEADRTLDAVGYLLGCGMTDAEWDEWCTRPLGGPPTA